MKRKGLEEALRTREVLNLFLFNGTYLVLSVVWPCVFTLIHSTYLPDSSRPLISKYEWRLDYSAILKTNHSYQANVQMTVNRWLCNLKDKGVIRSITFMSSWSLRSFFELGSTMVRTSFSSKKEHNNNILYLLAHRLRKEGLIVRNSLNKLKSEF